MSVFACFSTLSLLWTVPKPTIFTVFQCVKKEFANLKRMVFCYQNCSDLLWEKIVLAFEKNFWNSRLKAENLVKFWNHWRCLRSNELEKLEFKFGKSAGKVGKSNFLWQKRKGFSTSKLNSNITVTSKKFKYLEHLYYLMLKRRWSSWYL